MAFIGPQNDGLELQGVELAMASTSLSTDDGDYPAVKLFGSKSHRAKISIIDNISGIIKPGRFFRQFILYFCMQLASISMFRCLASVFQTMIMFTVKLY
ncbi:hypothetical protein CCACVL1_09249 [Corchorus capsularis]|uniref:Uncharacterized protein n=1 Tax=Corchorus capsularis TaxID=210143 RepID=A0A1R3IX49_COCAP|nr:hypothetical protein CCACVL1_09249 [Corchorus capsularis]